MNTQPSIAILGASTNREKYGNKAVRAFLQRGYTVFPINPRADEIEGLQAYPTIADIPVTPDEASFYLPPALGLQVIDQVAEKGIKRVWLNPGAESDELIKRSEELGIETIVACSIINIDVDPDEL